MKKRSHLCDAHGRAPLQPEMPDLSGTALNSITASYGRSLNARQAAELRKRAETAILAGGPLDEDSWGALVLVAAGDKTAAAPPWRLRRVDIRTRADEKAQPVARVELEHSFRGCICDIAEGDGPMLATMKAISQIVGEELNASGLHTYIRIIPHCGDLSPNADAVVHIEDRSGRSIRVGQARNPDLFTAYGLAYLDLLFAPSYRTN